jgi:diguanylate cyclase (GGDEF)-like protein/PAS domain S-box-containing protein
MHIDIFSAVIFNITSSFLMGLSLFFVALGHLGEIKGIKRWTAGLFFQCLGWTLLGITKILPEWISIAPIGTTILVLSLAFYYQALVEFKNVKLNINWTYYAVLLDFGCLLYFDLVHININLRVVVTAFFSFIFVASTSYLLLSKRFNSNKNIPTSHKMLGYIFILCAAVLLGRIVYFLLFPTQDIFAFNMMQSVSYLMFHIVISFTAFGFLLMCSEKYVGKQKQVEEDLRIAAAAFQTQEGIMITDANNVILNVNGAFSEITGYSSEEVIGQTPRILQSGQHDEAFYAAMWNALLNEGNWQGEIWNKRKNEQIYPQHLTITAVKNHGVLTNYVSTLIDITERKMNEETIKKLAFYDPLTQLPNRRLLHDRIKHGIESNRRTGHLMAVLMLDLDKFKAVNDNFGHAAGDELLKQVAKRIKACLREVDTVARLGGDEFVVLLDDIHSPNDSEKLANSLIESLTHPFSLSQSDNVQIGTSIGIAFYPLHGDDGDVLIDKADTALYHAKDNGKGRFTYFSETLLVSEEND